METYDYEELYKLVVKTLTDPQFKIWNPQVVDITKEPLKCILFNIAKFKFKKLFKLSLLL